jgi:hypothetical protein
VAGGQRRRFTPPWSGDAVLYAAGAAPTVTPR